MGKRGPRKMPDDALLRRGSRHPLNRAGQFVQLAAGELSQTPIINDAPTVDEVLVVLGAAVQEHGLSSPAHDLTLYQFAQAVVDRDQARKRWRDFVDSHHVAMLDTDSAMVERRLHSCYLDLHKACMAMAYDFGMTPAAIADMPVRAKSPQQTTNETDQAETLERSL